MIFQKIIHIIRLIYKYNLLKTNYFKYLGVSVFHHVSVILLNIFVNDSPLSLNFPTKFKASAIF